VEGDPYIVTCTLPRLMHSMIEGVRVQDSDIKTDIDRSVLDAMLEKKEEEEEAEEGQEAEDD
jgi:hypothetical protein